MPPFTAVLTRPAGQSEALMASLHAAGIETIDFPLIDISPVAAPGSIEALDNALRSIDRFSLVFFVSPNAIAQAFSRATAIGVPLADCLGAQAAKREPASPGAMDDGRPVVAVVGPGSVQALQTFGVSPDTHRIVAPIGAMDAQTRAHAASIRYDSEALVAALDAHQPRSTWAGKQVLVVRGDGGREWFADALREAGAGVEAVAAYRRSVPSPDAVAWQRIEALLDAQAHPRADPAYSAYAWVLSSSEGVRNLVALARERFFGANDGGTGAITDSEAGTDHAALRYRALLASPVIVPHARIAAAASAAGFDTITNPGAGDMNIVHAICAASERMKKSKGN